MPVKKKKRSGLMFTTLPIHALVREGFSQKVKGMAVCTTPNSG